MLGCASECQQSVLLQRIPQGGSHGTRDAIPTRVPKETSPSTGLPGPLTPFHWNPPLPPLLCRSLWSTCLIRMGQ